MTAIRSSSFASSISLEGFLEKKGSITTKKYWCRLNDSKLSYYNMNAKNQTECGSLVIQHVQSVRSGKGNTFEIIMQSKTHIFVAAESEVRDKWVTAVRDAMSIVNRRASTISRSSQNHLSILSQRSEDSDSVFLDSDIGSPPTVKSIPKLSNGSTSNEMIQKSSTLPPGLNLSHSSSPKPWTPSTASSGISKVISPRTIPEATGISRDKFPNAHEEVIARHVSVETVSPKMNPLSTLPSLDLVAPHQEVQQSKNKSEDIGVNQRSCDQVETGVSPIGSVAAREISTVSVPSVDPYTELNKYDGYVNRSDIEKSLAENKMDVADACESPRQQTKSVGIHAPPTFDPVAPPRKSRSSKNSESADLPMSISEDIVIDSIESINKNQIQNDLVDPNIVAEISPSLPVEIKKSQIAGSRPPLPSQKPVINKSKPTVATDSKNPSIISRPPSSKCNGAAALSSVHVTPSISPPSTQNPHQVRIRESEPRKSVAKPVLNHFSAIPNASDTLELDVHLQRTPIPELPHGQRAKPCRSAFDDIESFFGVALQSVTSRNDHKQSQPGGAVEALRHFLVHKT